MSLYIPNMQSKLMISMSEAELKAELQTLLRYARGIEREMKVRAPGGEKFVFGYKFMNELRIFETQDEAWKNSRVDIDPESGPYHVHKIYIGKN